MWLGMLAIIVAFGYAIVKFLTTLHMRRLRDQHSRLQQEIKRGRQRLQAVEGTLQINQSRRGSVQQKLNSARRFKDDLFNRLQLELPSSHMAELRQCINRHPVPEPEGVRTAHDLHLAEKVTAALTTLTILVVEIRTQESGSAHNLLAGELVKKLTALDIRFTGPEVRRGGSEGSPRYLTTAFDEPADALALISNVGATYPEHIQVLRAVLVAGIIIDEFDQDHVNRIFARTLHSTRRLVEDAEPGTLTINERAHELLGERPEILAVDGPDNLWVTVLGQITSTVEDASADEHSGEEMPQPEPGGPANDADQDLPPAAREETP
jgi:hypothetical protein